jgi:multidrug efflux pump subunit AcrA (membrane-fusion protein)
MPDSKLTQTDPDAGPLEPFAGSSSDGPTDAFWRRVEQMLADIADLAKADPLPLDFPVSVLESLHAVLLTSAGTFWKSDAGGVLRREPDRSSGNDGHDGDCHRNRSDPARLDLADIDEASHQRLVSAVVASGVPQLAPLAAVRNSGLPSQAAPHATGTLLLCPIKIEAGGVAVLELVHDDTAAVDAQLSLDVLRSVAELCADYLRRCRLRELTEERNARERIGQFTCRIHDSLDVTETAYTIANEGRRLIDCDRLTVLACRGPGCETLAVSGAARCDRRSNAIMRLEQLASVVAEGRSPLVFSGAATTLPPQVRSRLEAYVEAAQVRSLLVVPLISDKPRQMEAPRPDDKDTTAPAPTGVLVVEQFSGLLSDEQRQRTHAVCLPTTQALEHALQMQRIPWARYFRERDWRSAAKRGRVALAVAGCLTVLLLLACIVPADFVIEARGVLQPRNRRDVFAPDDGIVDRLNVDYATAVTAGQPLLVLRNPQLDLDLKRVWGELQAARKRLSAVESARVEGAAAPAATPVAARRLSGEDAELQELVASLDRQYHLLQEHLAELSVASPIAGQVLTWDVPQLLLGRPVHRGQVLLTVADPEGPWLLELDVPDRDAGHVIEARQSPRHDPLKVTYLVATDPGTAHRAVVDKVATSIERTRSGEPALRALVAVDRPGLPTSRPGATIIAKIHCGSRSLAYVWLHDLYYAVVTRLLF